jgi:hypothetical protein
MLRAAVAAAALVLTVAGPASARPQSDAPGNDGTIKIDGLPLDDLLDNEPHVGCNFQVDFFGFVHAEDLTAEVTFEAVAPTPGGVILTRDVNLEADLAAELDEGVAADVAADVAGEVGADVAGELATDALDDLPLDAGVALNARARFDLWSEGLADIEPHPENGWHVKLTVRVNAGSIGADVKTKVFWVQDCGTSSSTTSSTTPSASSTSTTAPEGPDDGTPPSTGGPQEPAPGSGPSDDDGSGSPGTGRPGTDDDDNGGGGLPLTGSNTLPLLGAGLGLLGLGGGTLYGARRLRSG